MMLAAAASLRTAKQVQFIDDGYRGARARPACAIRHQRSALFTGHTAAGALQCCAATSPTGLHRVTRPRIHLLALGGTIATQAGERGMKMGLGADDLLRVLPGLDALCDVRAETVLRVNSSSLTLDDLYRRAARIQSMADTDEADGVVITQGTNSLEESAFLLDLLLQVDIPVVMTAAMRNPSLPSADGPGNVLAAMRVAMGSWAAASAVGVLVAMVDQVWPASDVAKTQTGRVDAFRSPSTGPVATLVEDRVLPLMLPVRDWKIALDRALGPGPASRLANSPSPPVALLLLALGERGA